jgi:hypothetical protein
MFDFYTKKGYFVYDASAKSFSGADNEQVVLQRLTNKLSINGPQWKINPDLCINYTLAMEENDANKLLDLIRNEISSDLNVNGYTDMQARLVNGVLIVNIDILINGKNYTITVGSQ